MNKMFKSKKGILFTLLAILLSTLFILILTPNSTFRVDDNIDLAKSRASMVNSYYDYFINYLDFAVKISAKSCLNSISQHLVGERRFYDDTAGFYNNLTLCMLTSTISNITDGTIITLTDSSDKTLVEVLRVLTDLTYEDYLINTDYDVKDLSISQVDPELFQIDFELSFNISDKDMRLTLPSQNITVYVNFEGVLDPMYSIRVGTNKYLEDIDLIGEPEYSSDLYNLKFEEFINRASYLQYGNGTSLTNRFLNKTDQSVVSLVSFINASQINLPENMSYVDVEYYKGTIFNCSELYCLDVDANGCDDPGGFVIDSGSMFGIITARSDFNITTGNWRPVCD